MRINLIYNNLRDLIHIKEMVLPKYFGYKENNFSLYSDSYSSIRHFGEIDFLMHGQLYNNQNLLSSFSLKLIQNSVSIRKTGYKHPNPHKQEGRLRQESINLHLSNFRSINIRSFPYSKLDNSRFKSEDFNIDIMTNPVLVNEKSLEIYENSYFVPNNAPATYKHNIYSRQKQLSEFLDGRDGNSSISSHKKTVEIISKIYSIIKEESVNEKL